MNQRLRKIIFKKLYEDLKNVEIIPYKDSIWFIDRENEYWYFEYEKNGNLWWRWLFFNNYFEIFSLEQKEYESVISDWVEEVLNCRVYTTCNSEGCGNACVEEVLNCKVYATRSITCLTKVSVEEVLNCKVHRTGWDGAEKSWRVEEALNYMVYTTASRGIDNSKVEEVLNCKVYATGELPSPRRIKVEEVLNHKVKTVEMALGTPPAVIKDILNQKFVSE
jgi:hypothetical protein